MTELTRLFETTEDPLERALLSSALEERPSTSSLEEAALAVGLTAATAKAGPATLPPTLGALGAAGGASVGVAHGGLSASAGAALATSTGGATAAPATATLLFVTKSVVGGALASFLTIGALHHALEPTPSERESTVAASNVTPTGPATRTAQRSTAKQQSSAEAPLPEPSTPAPAPRRRAGPAPVNAESAPSQKLITTPAGPASASFAVPAAPPSFQPAAPTSSASLAAEIRVLDRARAALASRDFKLAAQLLDGYASSRPSGVLTREATLLRIRLLLAQGQKSDAVALARAFVVRHPENADADIRALANP